MERCIWSRPSVSCRRSRSPTGRPLAPCAFGIYLWHVQPFFFDHVFKFRFGFLDRVPDGLFAVAVLAAAMLLYLVLAALSGMSSFRFRTGRQSKR